VGSFKAPLSWTRLEVLSNSAAVVDAARHDDADNAARPEGMGDVIACLGTPK
jgi:hypothetical protein